MDFTKFLNQGCPNLIMMVGISGSGKSTIANEIAEQIGNEKVLLLSSDEIRNKLYNDENDQTHNEDVFNYIKKKTFSIISQEEKGSAVIIDATNLSLKDRSWIFHSWKKDLICNKIACIVPTPFDKCKQQNSQRERVVPEYVLDRQIRKFEIPFYEEGWDKIIIWDVNDADVIQNSYFDNFLGTPDAIMMKMNGFNQKNHHHKYELGTHCLKTYMEMQKSTEDPILLRAAQVHDIGKLYVQALKENSEECSYYQHHNYGSYYLLSYWKTVGIRTWMKINSVNDLLNCLFYVNYHMVPFFLESEKSINKYKNLWGEEKFNNLMLFNECDKIASGTERNK